MDNNYKNMSLKELLDVKNAKAALLSSQTARLASIKSQAEAERRKVDLLILRLSSETESEANYMASEAKKAMAKATMARAEKMMNGDGV